MEFKFSSGLVRYQEAMEYMISRVEDIIAGRLGSCIWFLEHPHLYTTGARGGTGIKNSSIPVILCDRGGTHTYHGPGQRIVYCIIDLGVYFDKDVGAYVKSIENMLILLLAKFGIKAFSRYQDNVGVWVDIKKSSVAKIASIGIKIKHWVAYHGFALNVGTDLSYYDGIVPCGIPGVKMTSMKELGFLGSIADVDCQLINEMQSSFCH